MKSFRSVVSNYNNFRQKLLKYAERFSHFSCLESRADNGMYGGFPPLMAGLGHTAVLYPSVENLSSIDDFLTKHQGSYVFAHFNYEYQKPAASLKETELPLSVAFPRYCLFVPQILIHYHPSDSTVEITGANAEQTFAEIMAESTALSDELPAVEVEKVMAETDYLQAAHSLIAHIHRGNIYEVNLCQEFRAQMLPGFEATLYRQLTAINPMPFSGFYGCKNFRLMCCSPERFLKKAGNKLISQPIKGTAARNKNHEADRELIRKMKSSGKEVAENVMIVDLVRNDLSRICRYVTVEELCGIYSFNTVHQMISTVSGELPLQTKFTEILSALFPAGSMTGAPKTSAMQLIEKHELTARGLYSGSIGYISPDGDFDFNVVIRSPVYDAHTQTLSFHTGSALTANALAQNEYNECMLKAESIIHTLVAKT